MQIDIVTTNKEHTCFGCKEEIDKAVYCIVRQGSGLSKSNKRFWFSTRYHLRCFANFLLTEVERKETNKGKGAGRPSILGHLTPEEKRIRSRTNTYLNYNDKRNLLKFYEEDNRPRTLDTWNLIAEHMEILLGFDAPFNLPWRDEKVLRLIVQNDTRLTMNLTEQDLKDFPKIIRDYVRAGRRTLHDE